MLQTILLVEDDEIDAMCVNRSIKKLKNNIRINRTVNGEDALNYLNNPTQEKPDLILLDINMPRMNGIEFLTQIKNHPKLRLIPAVILTTSQLEIDRLHAFNLNVAGFMMKPIELDKFLVTMDTVIQYWTLSLNTRNCS